MINKILTITLAFILSLSLLLGISACNSAEETTKIKENSSIGIESSDPSQVTDAVSEGSLITISKKAEEKLEILIEEKSYSQDVFFRIDTVRSVG